MVDLGLTSAFVDFSLVSVEHGGFGASPIQTSVWCSPAGFLSEKHDICKNKYMICDEFQTFTFTEMDLICYQLQEHIIKPASWNL